VPLLWHPPCCVCCPFVRRCCGQRCLCVLLRSASAPIRHAAFAAVEMALVEADVRAADSH